ncbi:MAG TPA: MBL fold metallo-hydrolase [Pseudolabrys sp.]|jgi:glyoxylase-like metal-dependent hydrolase (beta-lactamase superfamily II)|nr:MBL fold metallo-hydrolase [Pseudolabrys sp.]
MPHMTTALRALTALLAILCAPLAAAQGYAPLDRPLAIRQVPGAPIYYSIGSPGVPGKENQGNTSNAGFVVTDEGVVVFDALGTPSLGWALLEAIRKVTDKPVRYVALSHYHADHIYGLQAFRDHTQAVIVAQDRAREYKEQDDEIQDERAGARLAQRRAALAPWVDDKTRVVPPDVTFNDRLTLTLGGKTFRMIYAGPAHSASDMMMMVEPDGVLFAGDIVQSGRVPFMNSDDVDTKQWLKGLQEVGQLDPKFIIPGHGQPSTAAKEAIAFTRDYIDYVRTTMQKAVDNWTDFDVAYKDADWSKYKGLPAFDANNRGNAYRIFLELEAGQFKDGQPAR